MSDNQNQVSDQTNEIEELPTPKISKQGDSSTSDADAIVSKLTPIIEQIVERRVQSSKDKRISKIEKALGGRLDLLAELEVEGVQIPKDLRTQMQIRDLEERLTQQAVQPERVREEGTPQPKTAVAEALAELQKHELSSNDPDFIEILRGSYSSRDAFDLKVQRYINEKKLPPKQPNPADVVQSPVRGGAQEKSTDALTQDYKNEILAVPRGKSGDAQRRAIKDKYLQKGVNIHNVDFT